MINYRKPQPKASARINTVHPHRTRTVVIEVPEGQAIVLEPGDRVVLGTRRITRQIRP